MRRILSLGLAVLLLTGSGSTPVAAQQSVEAQRQALLAQVQILLERLAELQLLELQTSTDSESLINTELLEGIVVSYPALQQPVEFVQTDTGNRTQGFDAQSWYGHIDDELVVNFDLGSSEVVETFKFGLSMLEFAALFQIDDSGMSIDVSEEDPIGPYEIVRLTIADGDEITNSMVAIRTLSDGTEEFGVLMRVSYGQISDQFMSELKDLDVDVDGLYFKDKTSAESFLRSLLANTTIDVTAVASHITNSELGLGELMESFSGPIDDMEDSVIRDSVIQSRMDSLLYDAADVFADEPLYSACKDDLLRSEISDLNLTCVDARDSVVLYTELSNGSYYCIDHTEFAGRVDSVDYNPAECE